MIYKTVGVIGAGAWGTALAINIARGGANVILWSFDGEYKHFENIDIPNNLTVVTNPQDLKNADLWLNVTPAVFFRETIQKFTKYYNQQPVIICTKGADCRTHEFMTEILQSELPKCTDFGVLSGPQFAHEVALGIPTGSTLAGTSAKVMEAGLQTLNLSYLDSTDDIIGTQISGVGKNVMALIAGYIHETIKSENERALIFTRCCNEIIKLGLALGAELKTFTGLCGLGDLFLSATSPTSRNYSGGIAIARNEELVGTIEGIYAYETLIVRARKLDCDTPVLDEMREKMHKIIRNSPKYQDLFEQKTYVCGICCQKQ